MYWKKCLFVFFSIWVFFQEHSRITRLQGKGEGIPLTPHYHFHPLYRHLDISRPITAAGRPPKMFVNHEKEKRAPAARAPRMDLPLSLHIN